MPSLLWITCLLVIVWPARAQAPPDGQRPNVVLILTDDQGYADVGVYGAEGFATPHLDRMATQGIRFTSFYVSDACSPTRAALMTGSYPERVGIGRVFMPRSTTGLSPSEVTLAEVLRARGYATAAVGKWHLGDHPAFLPTAQGFDHYFGVPYSNDMSPVPANNPRENAGRYPPLPLLRDTTVIAREPDQAQLTRRYTEEAVRFIEARAGRPFFLYLAHSFPHVPLYAAERFRGRTARGLYGDVIEELDWSVGEVLAALERAGVAEETLVIFTSDNGPWLLFGDHGGSAGPLREGKATAFEGGHRVPAILRWPGRIPAGTVSDELVTVMDLLPTLAALAGAALPDDRILDGKNIWPILSGAPGAASPHEAYYYYRAGALHAVRSGRWKLHLPHTYVDVEPEQAGRGGRPGRYTRVQMGQALYDLQDDIGETTDVAGRHPEVVARLMRLAEAARRDLGDRLTGVQGRGIRAAGQVARPWHVQGDAP